MSGKCHVFPILKNHTLVFILFFMATWLAGCQSASNDSHNSVDDALASYNELFMAIKSKKAVGVEELISLVQEWRKLEATVLATMERDHDCPRRYPDTFPLGIPSKFRCHA